MLLGAATILGTKSMKCMYYYGCVDYFTHTVYITM